MERSGPPLRRVGRWAHPPTGARQTARHPAIADRRRDVGGHLEGAPQFAQLAAGPHAGAQAMLVAIALANKMARAMWAMITRLPGTGGGSLLRQDAMASAGLSVCEERDKPYGHVIEEIGVRQPGTCKEPRARNFVLEPIRASPYRPGHGQLRPAMPDG